MRYLIFPLFSAALAAAADLRRGPSLLRREAAVTVSHEEDGESAEETLYGVPEPIFTPLGGRQWWGFPNYARDQDVPLKSWEQLAREHGHYGRTCTRKTSERQCGKAFVCKSGTCVECQISRECGEHNVCVTSSSGQRLCVPRDLRTQWHWREVVCTILVVITAMLSAAAGMGGGGVYVPLLLLLLGLSTKEAVPLSQAMIVGGAIVNVLMFIGERHPKYPHKPKIDYDVIMMLNPGLAAGVTFGVIAHLISPQWLIVATLLVTLVIALQKSLTKGVQAWKKESAALAAQAAGGPASGGGPQGVQIKFTDFKSFAGFAGDNSKPMLLIGGCWMTFLALNLVKAKQCSNMYWFQLLGMLCICLAFTYAGSNVIRNRSEGNSTEGVLDWTPSTMWLYPLLSTIAGFLGGFLGIGGGIIMGPLLLELGMVVEANQATTAMFVLLSSSLATIQFVALGKAMPQFVFWFTTWVVLATFVGQTLIDYVLRRYQRTSIIVLSIAGIIAGSLVMMSFIGINQVYTDIQRGANMGLKPHHLCEG